MKYYPINEDLARRANEMNSFFEYVPGRATQSYRAEVDEAATLAERQKQRVDPMYLVGAKSACPGIPRNRV